MNANTQTESTALALTESPRPNAGALMMDVATMECLMRVADLMASGKSTVPAHLQKNPADCMAVVMQAHQWGMNPFAVAQKTHLVNGTLGYEAQLVNAVVQVSNSIDGRFHYEYKGTSPALDCRVGAVIKGESEITWGGWLCENKVITKNSPLWKTNPAQQLGYLQVKNWARLYCPGAILGVYTPDEVEQMPERNMGDAEVLVDVRPYIDGARATKTDADAAVYWKDHNAKFAKQLADHQALKDAVIAHRKSMKKANTVENAAEPAAPAPGVPGAPVVTYAVVLDKMVKARNLDALYVAADWIGEIEDPALRSELSAKFEEFKTALEAA